MKERIKKALLKIPKIIRDFLVADILEDNKKIHAKLDRVESELKKNTLDTMKLAICNDCIPLSERVNIGKEYISKGGNGAVKIKVKILEEEYENKLRSENHVRF
jgi:hypothetical protein